MVLLAAVLTEYTRFRLFAELHLLPLHLRKKEYSIYYFIGGIDITEELSTDVVPNEIYMFLNILLSFYKATFTYQIHLQISVPYFLSSLSTLTVKFLYLVYFDISFNL